MHEAEDRTADTTLLVTCAEATKDSQVKSFLQKGGIAVKSLSIVDKRCFEVQVATCEVQKALALSGEDLCGEAVRVDVGEPACVHGPLPDQITCPGCKNKSFPKTFLQNEDHLIFPSNVGDWIQKKGSKGKKLYRGIFFRTVNALMNSGGGIICIHAQTRFLAFLDEQVDDFLMKLVPDASLFEENFERHVLDDEHLAFRVKPRDRPLSTCDFNTKLSLNKGLADPDHHQMRRLMANATTVGESEAREHRPFRKKVQLINPRKGERIRFQVREPESQHEGPILWFHENKVIQAKAFPDEVKVSKAMDVLEYWWRELRLPQFISAFSKQEDGGSVFLGMKEEKLKTPAWCTVESMEGLQNVFKTKKKFWKTLRDEKTGNQEKNAPKVLYFAEPEDVPDKEEKTGCFVCDGVPLIPSGDEQEMREGMNQKLKEEMFWFPAVPETPVKLIFHSVEPSRDTQQGEGNSRLFVVQARVKNYSGICFHDRRGPEAFKFACRDNPLLQGKVRLSWDEWLKYEMRANEQDYAMK